MAYEPHSRERYQRSPRRASADAAPQRKDQGTRHSAQASVSGDTRSARQRRPQRPQAGQTPRREAARQATASSPQRRGSRAAMPQRAQRPQDQRPRRQRPTQSGMQQQPRRQHPAQSDVQQRPRRQQSRKQPAQLPLIPLAVALILVIGLVVFAINSCSKQEDPTTTSTASSIAPAVQNDTSAPYFASIQGDRDRILEAANAIPEGENVQTFSLGEQPASIALTTQQLQEIESAIDDYYGNVGFAVVNLDSGQGICFNANEALFGASSYKAAYAAYICSELVEGGALSLTSSVPGGATYWDPVHADQWDDPYCVGSLLQNAVLLSDNDAYESLRTYDYLGHGDWLYDMGLEDLLYCERSWYPDYSAAQGFNLWANIYSYLQSGTRTAQWLKTQLANTEVSFLRQGLGSQATAVWDKAGWDDDVANGYTAMTDCGIVQADGNTYLVILLTTMAGVEENFPYAYDLVQHTVGPCIQALT